MRYLIIDDHILVRSGLVHILKQELHDSDQCIDEASTSVEATTLLETNSYDLILLDISLGGRSGLDILSHINKNYPKFPVLIVSMHPEDQYALRTFKLGAAGYLSKCAAATDLITAVSDIFATGKYISKKVSMLFANELGTTRREVSNSHELLSNREIEVACLIAKGMTVKEIADHLNLSDKTINTYRSRLLLKLNIRNNVELTSYCIHNRLVV